MPHKWLQAATWNLRVTYSLKGKEEVAFFYCLRFFVFSHKWIKNSCSFQYQIRLLNWTWIKPVRWVLPVLVNSSESFWCAAKNTFKGDLSNFWWALNCRIKRTKARVSHHREWLITLWTYLTLKMSLAVWLACIALALVLFVLALV